MTDITIEEVRPAEPEVVVESEPEEVTFSCSSGEEAKPSGATQSI